MLKLLSSRYLSRYLKVFLLSVDLILLNLAYVLSLLIQYKNFDILFRQDSKTIWLFINLAWLVLTIGLEVYKTIRIYQIEKLIDKFLKVIFFHLCFIALIVLVLKFDEISRIRILWFYVLFSFSSISFHILFFILLKKSRTKGYNNRVIVILGPEESQKELLEFMKLNVSLGYKVLEFPENDKLNESSSDDSSVIDSINNFFDTNTIDEAYLCMPEPQKDKIKRIIKLCEDKMIRVKIVPDFRYYTEKKRVTIDFYNNIPVLMFRKEPLQKARFRIIKRLFDIGFSASALIFLVPIVFPIIAIAIRINSKGPIFYSQLRSGEDHREFRCYKFRSMIVNNSENVQASKNDMRITKVGSFLRKTSLDELPQFVNVLIGNMSVVGPRPHPLYMSKEYTELVNSYMIRHLVKPGITGWAQVNGYRGETRELIAMKKRVEYDIYYIENWSFLLDLRIIWRTVFQVVKGDEAAY